MQPQVAAHHSLQWVINMKILIFIILILFLILTIKAFSQSLSLESLIDWQGNIGTLKKSVSFNIPLAGNVTLPKGWSFRVEE